MTFIAGLRYHDITAPMMLNVAMDWEVSLSMCEHFCATPSTLEPWSLRIMCAAARLRDLPPYSPDLSPIENLFSKLKTLLRNAAKRSVDALWNEIGQLLQRFSPEECTNDFQSSGYHVWLNRKSSNARTSLSANNTSEDEKPLLRWIH